MQTSVGERAPLEPLLAALSDPVRWVRAAATEALGGLGERAPLEPLLAALSDSDWDTHRAAARALGRFGERASIIAALQALLADKNDVIARWTATIALATLSAQRQLGEWVPIEPLLATLDDGDSYLAECAARALGGLGHRAPIAELLMVA